MAGVLERRLGPGLLIACGAGVMVAAGPVEAWRLPMPAPEWAGIAAATAFAFFALVGFDDLVNRAEESKQPEHTLPRAILWSLTITAVLYALVSLAAVRAIPRAALAVSERPLALVWEAGTGTSAAFVAAIAVAAALSGILAQIVMTSRVIFGPGKWSPALMTFRRAHPTFGTPVRATLLVGVAVIVAALALPVALLAEVTTLALLVVFAIVNAALIGAKRTRPEAPFVVAAVVPWIGMAGCILAFAAAVRARSG